MVERHSPFFKKGRPSPATPNWLTRQVKLGLAARFCDEEGCQDVQEIKKYEMGDDFMESLGKLGRAQQGRLKKRLQQM